MSTSANEPQEIVENFQKLREQQQDIANEINKVDEETREHKRVIELLEKMPEDKRCYRVVGDTLVEYHVKDILPELSDNVKSFEVLITNLNKQLVEKGKEVNEYKEKNNIRFINEKEMNEMRKGNPQSAINSTATASSSK